MNARRMGLPAKWCSNQKPIHVRSNIKISLPSVLQLETPDLCRCACPHGLCDLSCHHPWRFAACRPPWRFALGWVWRFRSAWWPRYDGKGTGTPIFGLRTGGRRRLIGLSLIARINGRIPMWHNPSCSRLRWHLCCASARAHLACQR